MNLPLLTLLWAVPMLGAVLVIVLPAGAREFAKYVGVALALAASPDDVEDRMDDHADEIRDASSSAVWERPEKTQTRTQWDYIARIAEQVLLLLDLDPGAATQAVRDRFGSSGYESLQRTRI